MEVQTPAEKDLAQLLVEVLSLEDVAPEEIDPVQPLFDGGLGLDSIDALELAVAIAQKYDVHLKAEDEETQAVFATLRSLSGHIEANATAG